VPVTCTDRCALTTTENDVSDNTEPYIDLTPTEAATGDLKKLYDDLERVPEPVSPCRACLCASA
jgi:hypothetical protein